MSSINYSLKLKTFGRLIKQKHAYSNWASTLQDVYGGLKLPVDREESTEQGTLIPRIDLCHIGTSSVIGRREYNEDRLLACKLSKDSLLLGIFDGHGGSQAAEFAASLFPSCTLACLEQLRNSLGGDEQAFHRAEHQLFEPVMKRIFIRVNNLMMRHFYFYGGPFERKSSGTTASVVLIRHSRQVIVGHVGDSRVLICRGGHVQALSVNHDPNNTMLFDDIVKGTHGRGLRECDRITSCGGTIICNSLGVPVVNGRLGMTRSLGDAELKAFGVSARPFVTSLKVRHSNASFLALVSDGITHVMSDEEIGGIIASSRNPKEAAQSLVDNAMLFGSDDNASALVMPFGFWGKSQLDQNGLMWTTFNPLRGALS